MKVGIIGGGSVGGTLARRFLSAGLEVKVGVPTPSDSKYAGLPTCSPLEATEFGDVVLLATPWSATEAALGAISSALSGKPLVDATNPIAPDFSGLTHSYKDSGGLQVARWAPGARVVKAFNTIGFNIMENPVLDGVATTLLVAGDDPEAKKLTMHLAELIGFSPVDVGGLEKSALTEIMAWLWISLAIQSGRDFAFNLHGKK